MRDWFKRALMFVLLGFVIGLPFILRKEDTDIVVDKGDERLVVITPHNEAVRYEFDQGFRKWYRRKTGKEVIIDWRVLGGSQEIMRYIHSAYTNAFRLYWERDMGGKWVNNVEDIYVDDRIKLPENPQDDNRKQKIRRAFLDSNIGCGIDVLFGGGEVEARMQADKGFLVPSGIMKLHPDWFSNASIPYQVGGIEFWDKEGRWIGAAYSNFGIIFNRDVLKAVQFKGEPDEWSDLANEKFFSEVALADPMMSVSITRGFEMIIQQAIQEDMKVKSGPGRKIEKEAIASGWDRALRLIQLIAANGRYFTDSSTKPVLDVSLGDCGVGMAIDFYGLFQEENLKARSNSDRFGFVFPKDGTAVSPDPIAMLKGAKNKQLALDFIEYVLSLEGQKLWGFSVNSPGGPVRYALGRPAVRKELYAKEYQAYRINPELNAYRDIGNFVYHPEWTTPVFKALRFIIKSAFIDPHRELAVAWEEIIKARNEGHIQDALQAQEVLQSLDDFTYEKALTHITGILNGGDPLAVIKLRGEIADTMKKKYAKAKRIAEGGK